MILHKLYFFFSFLFFCRCRKDCFHKFSEEEKMYIIRKLNEMSSKLEQDTYLQNLIQCCDVKRRRPRKPKHEAKERVSNYLYFVNGIDRKVQVCRNAFISLHGLTNKKTRRLCLLLREGLTPTEARERVRCFRRSSCIDTQLNNWNCVPGYVYADPLWS